MVEDPDVLAGKPIADADWPLFGWSDDVRPNLAASLAASRPAVLATLYRVEGSAPRGPGAQMLFVDGRASGYFSGDCIEADVARHAAEVLGDGQPRRLHYGTGSPWIDIRLRCGGALYVLVERILPDSHAARGLLRNAEERMPCLWSTNGMRQELLPGEGAPLISTALDPLHIRRRFDPPRRLIVSGGDPGALALAHLAANAQFDTILLRPAGPSGPPPFAEVRYLREEPSRSLPTIGVDRWTAYVGATHEDHHDLGGCLYALRHGAGYVGMIGAKSRSPERLAALEAAGATRKELAQLRLAPGIAGLGKAPWEVAVAILAEVMQAFNPTGERA
ncbi:MAG: XdhC family protein [Cupriavidus sp.]|jgi:xanthine dehydrogenase accessory factor|nr:XdhC family protein [Pseudomonadota bacterium]TXI90382.1 MAG: XdhC family protein [Cupriavidus sp.]